MGEKFNVVETVKRTMPAVVSIVIEKSVESLEKEIPPELMLPFAVPEKDGKMKLKLKHPHIPKELANSHGMIQVGGGSGFVAAPNGVVVTNKHVVADPNAEYTAILDDGRKFHAEILARDPIDDVAILKIDAERLTPLSLGDSGTLELGEEVLAIGNSLGIFKNTVSRGIVSGLSRSIRAATELNPAQMTQELRGLIQTDAAINPGNSGGPLVNLRCEAIGINAAIIFGAQNLGFAIPINTVKRDLQDLARHGRIRRPLLGLRYLMIDEVLQNRLKLPVNYGAVIVGQPPHTLAIIPGSPADKAGLKIKDIILECDGERLSQDKTIQDILEQKEVGDALNVKVLRGKKTILATIVLTERK